jgi:hypothetical protein
MAGKPDGPCELRGPKDAGSTVLTVEEEAVIIAFRRHRFCRSTAASMRFSRRFRI